MAAGVGHPCVDFIADAPFPFYAINNYGCHEMPYLEQGGRIMLPKGFPVTLYNTRQLVTSLREDEEVTTIGVIHLNIGPAIYDPWVVFAMDNGRQGEFSINSLLRRFKECRTMPETHDMMTQSFGQQDHDKGSFL